MKTAHHSHTPLQIASRLIDRHGHEQAVEIASDLVASANSHNEDRACIVLDETIQELAEYQYESATQSWEAYNDF